MDVSTIEVPYAEALAKFEEYKGIPSNRRLKEDDELQMAYKAALNGGRILNLTSAFKQTGLNELKQPRLAIARADWAKVHCLTDGSRRGWGPALRIRLLEASHYRHLRADREGPQ